MKTTRTKTAAKKTHGKSVLGRSLADLLPSAAGPAQALLVALAPVVDDADVAYELDAGDVSVLPDVPGDAPLPLSESDVVFVPPVPRPMTPALDARRLTASHVRHVARMVRIAREAA